MSQADPGKAWRADHGLPVVAAIDGYRTVAILGVALFHTLQVCGAFAAAGDGALGILLWGSLPRSLDVLFVVSGFVMYLPMAARGQFGSVRIFAIRRAARIVPGYWIALAVTIALLVALRPPADAPSGREVLLHLSFLHTPALMVDGDLRLGLGVIPPVWTLSVEVAFYLVLPLVAAWWYRRPFAGLAAAAVLLILWRETALHATGLADRLGIGLEPAAGQRILDYYASQFPAWSLALGCGMTFAWLYVTIRDRWPAEVVERRAVQALGVAAVALGVAVYFAGHSAVTDENPFTGLFARQPLAVALGYPVALTAVLLSLTLAPRRVQAPIANRPMSWLADISYGVYLIHFAIIFVLLNETSLPQEGDVASAALWTAIVLAASVPYAYLSSRLVERPARAWAHRFGRRRERPSATATPAAAEPSAGPLVSIVIATHDRAGMLPETLDSVLAQTYRNLEVLVLDDGSTDDTPRVMAAYVERHGPDRLRFERHPNMGQARTLNRGYGLARGDLVGYLSDDDLLAPDAVAALVAALEARPDAAGAYPAYRIIDGDGTITDTWLPREYTPTAALTHHDTIIGPGALVRRAALQASGGWDPSFRYIGDMLLWMAVARSGPLLRVARPLASWRLHAGSATRVGNLPRALEHLRALRRGLELDPATAADPALHAEAVRNACVNAHWFAGDAGGRPLPTVVDLDRPLVSAFVNGDAVDAPAIDVEGATAVADRLRELALLTLEVARARTGRSPATADRPGEGLRRALAALEGAGLLSGADPGLDGAAFREALAEAAYACGLDAPSDRTRYVIPGQDEFDAAQDLWTRIGELSFARAGSTAATVQLIEGRIAACRAELARA